MRTPITQEMLATKASELGIWEEALACALTILAQNRHMVNALDNASQMDEYIYLAIIKGATEKRRQAAEAALESGDESVRYRAQKELSSLSREELITDPHYRAVLPIVIKIVANGPVLRLHADEAAEIIFKLADFKRKHRSTSITHVIVTKCGPELESFDSSQPQLATAS